MVLQTAVALWERFAAYDPAQPFTPWACRFDHNKARQWIERLQRWCALLDNGLAEELALRREELGPRIESCNRRLEGCVGLLPDNLFQGETAPIVVVD
jgi:DNA-directed RNA polymerase specialized sigma24 family protein